MFSQMTLLRTATTLALFPLSTLAVSPGQSINVSDHGQHRRYTVAADESAAGRRVKRSTTGATGNEEIVLYPADEPRSPENRRIATKRIAAQLAPDADAATIATSIGARVVGKLRSGGWQVFELSGGPGAALDAMPALRRQPGVINAEPLLARMHSKRGGAALNDPLLNNEWHLNGMMGANVLNAWGPSSDGSGVTIAIVDDGLQHSHPDLNPNYSSPDSFDFNGGDADPEPPSYFLDDHGTACAGVAAAFGNNGIGVAGVAYHAKLAGLRLISAPVTDQEEADAFEFNKQSIHIKSNSWGPSDRLLSVEGPGPMAAAALEDSVKLGRNGLGTIFVFACGNGGEFGDYANFDGYVSRRETIAVGAVTDAGVKASYSEEGTCLLVTAPSSGGNLAITTTDRVGDDGFNFDGFLDLPDLNYTEVFGGTSSACPLVAGVIALMIHRNPLLGWRDVQEILIRTAKKTDPNDPDWITNGAKPNGLNFNHKYGAGLVDAAAAVQIAGSWTNLGENIKTEVFLDGLATPIPDGKPAGVEFTMHVESDHFRVEHVLLTTSIRHARRGQLEITLTSPDGTESRLARLRRKDKGSNYEWTFSSVRHWGEMAKGDWKVRIADRVKGKTGTVQSLRLTLWGAAPTGALIAGGIEGVAQPGAIASIPAGSPTEVDFVIRNAGTQMLNNVVAALAPNAALTGNVISGSFSTIAPGEEKSVRATLTAIGALGIDAKPTLNISANGYSDALRYSLTIGNLQSITVSGSGPISLPSFASRTGAGRAAPYAVTAEVSGIPPGSVVTDVKLHLHHVDHERSRDIDTLLVSPDGKRMIAMSDAGGFDVLDAGITLTDSAQNALPDTAPLFSGTYRPSNYGATLDKFPAPAPPKPYQSSFSIFRGSFAAGTWKLFFFDDASRRLGSIGAWDLEIQYAAP
jgi:subtilisin-like proprotein convertase family protein/subtilisin family serine protease